MQRRIQKVFSIGLALAMVLSMLPLGMIPQETALAADHISINEIRIDQPSTDNDEYFELSGPAGASLSGLTYLVIGDGSAGSGVIEEVTDLDGYSLGDNGLFVAAEDTFTLASADLTTDLNFENSDNVTHLLVSGFSGANGDDLDTNDDGVLDVEPWDELLDLIALIEEENPPSSTEYHYGPPTVGPDVSFVPGHIYRCGPNWEIGTFDPIGISDTPGAENTCLVISEIRIDQPGTDNDEYFELSGLPGTLLDGLTYLVIGDGSGGSGVIENVTSLSGYSIPASGFFVAAESTFTLGSADLTTSLNFENGDNVTHLLVSGFSGANGDDLDTNNDGVLDVQPWDELLDLIALIVEENPPTTTEFHYGPPTVGPDGIFVPGHVYRCGSEWRIGPFTLGAKDSPGLVNPCGVLELACESFSVPVGYGGDENISAIDTDGVITSLSLLSVDPMPAAGSIELVDFVPATAPGETATATLSVSAAVPAADYTVVIEAANNDLVPETVTCTLVASVAPVLTIGEVQGSVSDTDDGRRHVSPYEGQTVYVQGLIYQRTQSLSSSGTDFYGFFMQSAPGTDDGDPNSSDGLFVFMNRFPDLIGGYVPQVGDEVILRGRVSEFFNLTQVSSASLEVLLRSGVDVTVEAAPQVANPPNDFAEAGRYWERLEGMHVEVPTGSTVLAGRSVFASTADGEVWVAAPTSPIWDRMEPYTNRAFRDPHPLDDIPDELFDNNNGYRIIMGSHGLKAATGDGQTLIAPASTFDSMQNSPSGGVYFSFSKYQIMIDEQLDLTAGIDPADNAPPQEFDRTADYSVVTFNMENLYDYRDDPFDGCDFPGNPGCPGVSPPFDYVPESEEAYFGRVAEIAQQIVDSLHSPDILMVQEIEDQDICVVEAGEMVCGGDNNADGQPDPLQDVALAVLALGGPDYLAALDRDGADDRGIVSGYLFRADRVELLPAYDGHPVLGSMPEVIYDGEPLAYNMDVQNPKVLNAVLPDDVDTSTGTDGPNVFTRPVQVGYFRVWRDGMGLSVFTDLYLLNNHFSSGPDRRVGQRTEQAAYNAAILAALEASFGELHTVVGGDLNVFPRPDDPFFPGDPLFPSDQLGPLYDQGLTNLYDILLAEAPESAYSYTFEGQAQTLDQLFASSTSLAELTQMRAAHINADFPSDYSEDGPRGTSDHDPQLASFSTLPTLQRLEDLVRYYDAAGDITGRLTARILITHLRQAEFQMERGNERGYLAALRAFTNHVAGFTPQWITESASAVLISEAELLLDRDGLSLTPPGRSVEDPSAGR